MPNSATGHARIRGLYAITPDARSPERLIDEAERALAGGAALLQLRRKSASDADVPGLARALRDRAHRHGALFFVNDDANLALASNADGVHVGRDDANLENLAELRSRRTHRPLLVGVSCYADLQRARAAEAAGADYVAFGAFFPSATKPLATPAPLALLREARPALRIPVVAIGGITPDNAPALISAGADALAVIGALFDVPDPEAAAQRFSRLNWNPDEPT